MGSRQRQGKLCGGIFLLLMLARPVFTCLSVVPVTPASAHECCRHSCQHQHKQEGMEQCCRQQHHSPTQPPVLGQGKSAQIALDAGAVLTDSPFITPSAVAEPTFVSSHYFLGRIYTPPPFYLLHATLRI